MTSKAYTNSEDQIAALRSATTGFDHLFANRMEDAKVAFQDKEHSESPFHLMGLGVCSFLEAALGMESEQMTEAARCLTLCESSAKKHSKAAKDAESSSSSWLSTRKTPAAATGTKSRLPSGIEWEILQADAVVCQGLTHAMSESYMGYLQCLYLFNSAHTKFTKLYKTVFPHGIDSYVTPATTPLNSSLPSRNPSTPSFTLNSDASSSTTSSSSSASVNSTNSNDSTNTTTGVAAKLAVVDKKMTGLTLTAPPSPIPTKGSGFFGRWTRSAAPSPSASKTEFLEPKASESEIDIAAHTEGPVEELVVSGAAFGFGLFNLAFSLLPAKVKTVVGFLGFQHDRKVALQALAVSAARSDVHAVFSGLALMTYHGVILNFSGFQADEAHIVKQYQAIVEKLSQRYPGGSLWVLNRAKILRMTYDPDGAITVLQKGLSVDRPENGHFRQADAVLEFELAWTLLSERRYSEAAEAFIRMKELNNWSHATYHYLAAGCLLSVGNEGSMSKAQELLADVPSLLDRRKIGGRDLPTEVYIKHKISFYKAKQKRRGGKEDGWHECVKIGLADEMGVFWNMFARIRKEIASAYIKDLYDLTPLISEATTSNSNAKEVVDLDTPDELAVRALLLGLLHRTLGEYERARSYFDDAVRIHAIHGKEEISAEGAKWVGGVALFEEAVGALKELQDRESSASVSAQEWTEALKSTEEKLEKAISLSGNNIDLSSRLDSRANMLRGEIALKKEMLGISR
ncbi:hypothetical protein SCHPADRAFT_876147 [Schizopora paradoxa]|uniref:Mitochondrial outer membrane protein IML2 n=1 Tax=Schizopora paradoxa TaxID=27342 RepID=A0A0H2RJ20_9AGAM|nr:hypothetical protein SCHPADRAFT_876147 [Schizopora paradoxa]